jgi:hypothetical protein
MESADLYLQNNIFYWFCSCKGGKKNSQKMGLAFPGRIL